MARTNIPPKTELELWVKAAGRCQYEGCNEALLIDPLTLKRMNRAYKAHIIADSPKGPRGDQDLSPELATDIDNLMLLCDPCHRRIDREEVSGHTPERLRSMKRRHEERIALVTGIAQEMKTEVLLYGARIGVQHPQLSMRRAAHALMPARYPQSTHGINLSMQQGSFDDKETLYWQIEEQNLVRQFEREINPRLADRAIEHLSVFGLAPQPLLIRLGTLLSDLPTVDVYQLHREPQDWCWQDHPEGFSYVVKTPDKTEGVPALVFALSADIAPERIHSVLSPGCSLWVVTIDSPNNDFLKSSLQLRMFREIVRGVMNQIKSNHGNAECIHVFPAMPVATAIEFGRVWMPKADLPLKIYDENAGFKSALDIGIKAITGGLK